ncbi:MAG: hypothetical protein ACRD2E_14985 [Terriglobales bacterium]
MTWFWLFVIFFVLWIITWAVHVIAVVVFVLLGLWIAMILVVFFRALIRRGAG